MRILIKIGSVFDHALNLLAILASVLLVFMMLSISTEIVMRYFLNRPIVGIIKITEICLLFVAFLGTAWLLRREGHVKMDIIVNRLQPRTQAFFGIFSSLLGAIVCWVLVWYGVEVTVDHFLRGTYQATTLEIPNAPILAIIPLGSLMFFVQCLRRAYGYFMHWRTLNREPGL